MSRLGACPAGERDSYAVTHFRPMQLEGSGCFAKLYEFTGKLAAGSNVLREIQGRRAIVPTSNDFAPVWEVAMGL